MTTRVPKHLTNGRLAAWQSSVAAAAERSAPPVTPLRAWTILLAVFFAVHVAALFTPSLLDDADAAHAQVAKHIAETGDWVTFSHRRRPLSRKSPAPLLDRRPRLPPPRLQRLRHPPARWPSESSPARLLAWVWARRAYGERAALLRRPRHPHLRSESFLFTRIYHPRSHCSPSSPRSRSTCLITGLEDRKPANIYLMWAALALGVLTKGLDHSRSSSPPRRVPYLILTGTWRRWRELRLLSPDS